MAGPAPSWDLYRSFLAVMEEGSLSAAARALRVAQPTIGRHVQALEAALGSALFTRSASGLRATDTALAIKPHAEAVRAAVQALLRAASGDAAAARGIVRLSASEIVGAEVLPPMLAGFRQDHPGIDIELVLSNRQEDLLRRDADIAVRMARPSQEALLARKIGEVPLVLCAHRSYLRRNGAPETIEDLAGHCVIGFDRAVPPAEVRRSLPAGLGRELFALRTDSDLAQLAALRAGFGIAACQAPIAARDPDLVPVLTAAFGMKLPIWVAMHEDLRASRRTRLLFDHLVKGLTAYLEPPLGP